MTSISNVNVKLAAAPPTTAPAGDGAAVECTPADRQAKNELTAQIRELEGKIKTRSDEIKTATIGTSTRPDWMGIGGFFVGGGVLGFAGYKIGGVYAMLGAGLVGGFVVGALGRAWGTNMAAKAAGLDAITANDTQIKGFQTQLDAKQAAFSVLDARC